MHCGKTALLTGHFYLAVIGLPGLMRQLAVNKGIGEGRWTAISEALVIEVSVEVEKMPSQGGEGVPTCQESYVYSS